MKTTKKINIKDLQKSVYQKTPNSNSTSTSSTPLQTQSPQ